LKRAYLLLRTPKRPGSCEPVYPPFRVLQPQCDLPERGRYSLAFLAAHELARRWDQAEAVTKRGQIHARPRSMAKGSRGLFGLTWHRRAHRFFLRA